MEFDFSDILLKTQIHLPDENEENLIPKGKLNFLYRYRKMSKNQNDFAKNLIKNILNNQASLFEFSPTLDKLFLICSSLITILNFEKSIYNNNLNEVDGAAGAGRTGKKFILILKTEDLIFEALNNFKDIMNLGKLSANKKLVHQIVPFLDRKVYCINEKAMENASALDFDTFCNAHTNSWIDTNSKCSSFNVLSLFCYF